MIQHHLVQAVSTEGPFLKYIQAWALLHVPEQPVPKFNHITEEIRPGV